MALAIAAGVSNSSWLDLRLLRDLRFAWRGLRLRPLASAAAIATLALGIGAQFAVFRVFDVLVTRPLPFNAGDQLVRLYIEPRERSGPRLSPGAEVLLALQRETRSFAAVVGQRYMDLTLRHAERPERVAVIGVTAGWAETLGIAPQLGRVFRGEEEVQGMASGVALIGHATWQGLLGGDPQILGRRLQLGERVVTVVGVMPPGFAFPYEAQLWVPLRPETDALGPWGFFIPARLKPGISLEAANRELAALADRLPGLEGRRLTAVPLREVLFGRGGRLAGVLLGAMVVLLALVCANLAGMFLVRSLSRARELAVRAALGARGRWIARQLLAEALLLSLLGAVVGCGLAALLQPVLGGLLPDDVQRLGGLPPLDLRAGGVLVASALGCGLAFGVLPALRGARQDPAGLIRGAGRATTGPGRLRALLVSAEVALAVLLVAGGTLLVVDLLRRERLDFGYDAARVLTMSVSFTGETNPAVRAGKITRIVAALAAVPGVETAGATCIFPSERGNYTTAVLTDGDPVDAEPRLINHRLVTPGFLAALRVPLLAGRALSERDGVGGEPVALVSASLARRAWPGERAIGRRLRAAVAGEPERWLTVVGVVGDVAEFYDIADTRYLPLAQHEDSPRAADMVFALRMAGHGGGVATPILRQAVWSVDPALAVYDVETPGEIYRGSLAAQRAAGKLAGTLGGLALLIAVVGVYAAMAAWAAERRHELAVRMAVGASPRRLLVELAGKGFGLVALGALAGVAGAPALAGLLRGLIEGVEVSVAGAAAFATAVIVTASLAACLAPAWRAMQRDPLAELRAE